MNGPAAPRHVPDDAGPAGAIEGPPLRPPKALPRGPRLFVTIEDVEGALGALRGRSRLYLPTRRPLVDIGVLIDVVLRVRGQRERLRVPGRVVARRPLRGPRGLGPGLSIEPFDVPLVTHWLSDLERRRHAGGSRPPRS